MSTQFRKPLPPPPPATLARAIRRLPPTVLRKAARVSRMHRRENARGATITHGP
jgi:hypothetical protein